MRLKNVFRLCLLAVCLLTAGASSLFADELLKGLQPGAHAPAFSLADQQGRKQDLSTLSGSNGLLVLFFRSADWCPFCKGQLVDLASQQKAFAAKGINVAAISYDSPAILADFAHRHSIDYPLLSDTSSSVIDAFGIRNPEGTGMQAGIPYPGFYLINRSGIIEKRFFETAYVNRLTAGNVYSHLFGAQALPAASKQLDATPHATITTVQSDTTAAPGAVVNLAVVIQPGPDTHIYAPGAEKLHYHVAALHIAPSDLYTASPVDYPKSEMLHFPELDQTVPVYTAKTILSTSAATVVNQHTIPLFGKANSVTVKGTLEYQPCTSKVCFPPVSVPVSWTIGLKSLDRERSPKSLQHK